MNPAQVKNPNEIFFNGTIVTKIFLEERLVGYVCQLKEDDFTISFNYKPHDWAGSFLTFEEAKEWLIERCKKAKNRTEILAEDYLECGNCPRVKKVVSPKQECTAQDCYRMLYNKIRAEALRQAASFVESDNLEDSEGVVCGLNTMAEHSEKET